MKIRGKIRVLHGKSDRKNIKKQENPSKKSIQDGCGYQENPKTGCFSGPIFQAKPRFSLVFSWAEVRFLK